MTSTAIQGSFTAVLRPQTWNPAATLFDPTGAPLIQAIHTGGVDLGAVDPT